jgi:short-subunit dehydrogenase
VADRTNLKDRPVALVTGASAGLGREIARRLVLDRGMVVLATARRLDRLVALRDELPEGSIRVLEGDLASDEFRSRLWEWAEAQFGRVDLLVNNAGLGNYADFAEQDFDAIRLILEVNLVALMDLTQRAIRHMRLRKSGQILQISSTVGSVGMPYAAAYVASKHAVNGLTKTLRYELKGSGVRIWAACPGRIRTEFRASALGDGRVDHASAGGASRPGHRARARSSRRFSGPDLGCLGHLDSRAPATGAVRVVHDAVGAGAFRPRDRPAGPGEACLRRAVVV